jgi:hypothetical protein
VAGIIVAAVIVAAMGVTGAFRQEQENEEQERVGTTERTTPRTNWSGDMVPV